MNSEIICAIIGALSALLSACVAYFVSKFTAKKQIQTLLLTWNREDAVSYEQQFKKMVELVTACTMRTAYYHKVNAAQSVLALRAKTNTKLAQKLDALCSAIKQGSNREIEQALAVIIQEYSA